MHAEMTEAAPSVRKWKRKVTWAEMSPELRAAALERLKRLALAKAQYDGTLLPYAWAERVAPKLRYTLAGRGTVVWDMQPMPKDQAAGWSVFTLPVGNGKLTNRP